jgi:signal peptidase II
MGKKLTKYLVVLLLMLGGCKADFHSKKWAENNLKGNPTVTVLKGFLDLGFAENHGMIFGIFNGKMGNSSKFILTGIRAIILIGLTIFIFISINKSFFFLIPFILIWAGAIGNLIDPFIYGYVVDFIHLKIGTIFDWPFFFNLADAYVTVGMIILLIKNVRGQSTAIA